MAGLKYSYQPNEFGVGIAAESTTGTVIANTTQLFTESVSLPSFSPIQDLAPKSAFFVAKDDAVYSTSKLTPSEVTVSGLLNDGAMSLLEGILHTAASSSVITVGDSYTAPALADGATTAAATRTYTVKVLAPQTVNDSGAGAADQSVVLPGCSVTAFSVSGDASGDGRLTYSATFKTGYTPLFNQAAGSTTAPTESGFRNIHDLTYRKIAGITGPVMQSFTLSIENPAEYIGWDPVNNKPYSISRSVPEGPVVNLSSVIKLDQHTNTLLGKFMNASAQVSLDNHLSNDSGYDVASATEFGFNCDKAIITGMSLNEQAAMMYSVEQKLLFGQFSIRNS